MIEVRTRAPVDVIDVTREIERWLREIGAEKGLLHIFIPHTTAGIFINEAEGGLVEDIKELLKRCAPEEKPYLHNRIDHNAHAHLRSTLLGSSVTVPVEKGRLLLGTWQRILVYEGDGSRARRIVMTYIGL